MFPPFVPHPHAKLLNVRVQNVNGTYRLTCDSDGISYGTHIGIASAARGELSQPATAPVRIEIDIDVPLPVPASQDPQDKKEIRFGSSSPVSKGN